MRQQPELPLLAPRQKLTMVTKLLLGAIAALALMHAISSNWLGHNLLSDWLAADARTLKGWQLQRLLSAPLLTSSVSYTHALFALMMLYFFGPSVEQRLGSRGFALLFFGAGAVGTLTSLLAGLFGLDRLGGPFFGPYAALEAVLVAWSLQNANAVFALFFVVQMRGAWMKWISLALCLLGLLYPNSSPEGRFAPLAGFAVGYLFGGAPSVVRSLWLKRKFKSLQAEQEKLRAQRKGEPSLRVIYGGLADELGLEKEPKTGEKRPDKRTLN